MFELSQENLKKYWKVVLGYILVAIAIAVFFWGNHAIAVYKARGAAGLEWPTVQGRIIESRVEERFSTDENRGSSYLAVIRYEYVVNDVRYTNDRLDWQDYMYRNSMAEAQKLADSYPEGMTVLVHYDPEKPDFGLLDTTLPEQSEDVWAGYFWASGAVLAIAAALIYAHTGMLFRVPGRTLSVAGLVLFIGGAALTVWLGVYFNVLIGVGMVSFVVGAIVRNSQ